MYESPKDACAQAFAYLRMSWIQFFRDMKNPTKVRKAKQPTFKTKRDTKQSFYLSNDKLRLYEDLQVIQIPHIGRVRLTEMFRLNGRVLGAVISFVAGHWYVGLHADVGGVIKPRIADGSVGIDLGVSTALMLSDGTSFDSPKPLKTKLKQLQVRSRQMTRKTKGSVRWKRAADKLGRLHHTIGNIRKDWAHKVTTKIVRENQTICLEDLPVRNMLANRTLSRAVSDIGFGMLRRMLEYKAPLHGSVIGIVDRWFPSSKLCSRCGTRHQTLRLRDRVFVCPHCGLRIDRDLNAAVNIHTAGLAEINARGHGSAGQGISPDETAVNEPRTGTPPMGTPETSISECLPK